MQLTAVTGIKMTDRVFLLEDVDNLRTQIFDIRSALIRVLRTQCGRIRLYGLTMTAPYKFTCLASLILQIHGTGLSHLGYHLQRPNLTVPRP